MKQSNCGINVPLNNPEIAAKEIYNLSYDQERITKMGKEARRLAETSFNRDILAEKYLKYLKEISESY